MRASKRDMSNVRVSSSEIRKRAFENVRELVEVKVQDGLVTIGDYAFYNCFLLKDINVPPSVKVIGRSAFAWCARLPPPKLPSGLESMGENSFSHCSFPSFHVPILISELKNGVFSSCVEMVSLEMPERVELIEDEAFSDCPRLRNVAVPSSVTSTGRDLFKNCKDLEKLYPNHDELLQVLKHRFDGLPIHKICYYQSYYPTATTLENLENVLKSVGNAQDCLGRQDCLGMTPLHILALSTKPNLKLFQALLKHNQDDLITKDKWGDLPLYYACFSDAPLEIVKLFLEVHKTAFLDQEMNWTRMVEVSRSEVTECLLETHNKSFPDQTVNWNKLIQSFLRRSLEKLKCIFKYSVAKRLSQLGKEDWRSNILKDIERMPGSEGLLMYFWNVRRRHIDLVYCKLEKYELVEATTLLEMAVWKSNMHQSSSANLIKGDYQNNAEIDDAGKYRKECLVTCGAEIIMENIMPFLIGETQDKLLFNRSGHEKLSGVEIFP
jgi:hypothetical protein